MHVDLLQTRLRYAGAEGGVAESVRFPAGSKVDENHPSIACNGQFPHTGEKVSAC